MQFLMSGKQPLPLSAWTFSASCCCAGEERQQMAGRCLGELVRKMGDRVLQQIIPILVRGMQDPEASTRQGVCTGLKEVLDNISREQLQEYLAQLLPTVQAALCDEDTTVRQACLLPCLCYACCTIAFRPGSLSSQYQKPSAVSLR